MEAWNLASSLKDKVPRDFASVLKKAHKISAFRNGTSDRFLRVNIKPIQGTASGLSITTAPSRVFANSFLDGDLTSTAERDPPLVLKKELPVSGHRNGSFIREQCMEDCFTRSHSILVRATYTSVTAGAP